MSDDEVRAWSDTPFLMEKASQVQGHVSPNEDGSREVSILIILAIIGTLIQIYQCWRDRKRALAEINSPSFVNRWLLRRHVKRHLGADLYRKNGAEVVDGILSVGSMATDDDLSKFLAESTHAFTPKP